MGKEKKKAPWSSTTTVDLIRTGYFPCQAARFELDMNEQITVLKATAEAAHKPDHHYPYCKEQSKFCIHSRTGT